MLRLQIRVSSRNRLLHGLFLHLFHRVLRLRGFVLRKGSHWHMQLRLLLGQVVKPLFGVVGLRFVIVALLFGIVILHNGICLRCLNLANSRRFCLVQAVVCALQFVFCLLWLVLRRVRWRIFAPNRHLYCGNRCGHSLLFAHRCNLCDSTLHVFHLGVFACWLVGMRSQRAATFCLRWCFHRVFVFLGIIGCTGCNTLLQSFRNLFPKFVQRFGCAFKPLLHRLQLKE